MSADFIFIVNNRKLVIIVTIDEAMLCMNALHSNRCPLT